MPVLPDLLGPGLRLVICGSAAGRKSADVGAYYAGPGNRFWDVLHKFSATPRRFQPAEFPLLLALGIGLTDIVKEASGADSDLRSDQFDPIGLRARIEHHAPRILIFNGKRSASAFFGQTVDYGYQAGSDIGPTRIHVAPSTSGSARGFWDERHWQQALMAAGFERGSRDDPKAR